MERKMKSMKQIRIGLSVLASALVLGLSGGVFAEEATLPGTASTPTSAGGVMPYIIDGANPGGNRTCEEVAEAFGTSFLCATERVNYDDETFLFDNSFGDIDPSACAATSIAVTTDGKYVTWSATPTPASIAAIVKGSNDANIYYYPEPTPGDSGLASPLNDSGDPAGLSNLTFCWNPDEGGEEPCWYGETAWAAGDRYVNPGNWATYTPYSDENKTVTLYAGQTLPAGSVNFSAPTNGEVIITITLNDGWRFAPNEDDESDYANVKIQDYADAPSGNPAPGLFEHRGYAETSPFSITVPQNHFYGVHVDVEQARPCPENEVEEEE
jgi:hypothetical protein